MGVAPSYAVLVLVQAALVVAPGRPRRLVSSRSLGLAIPAGAMVVGVAGARAHGGAELLTALAAVATPVLAAGAGWARGWRLPLLPPLLVPPLYVLAWLRPGTLPGEAAGVALIAGACLATTGVVAALAAPGWLTVGLVLLVLLDVFLVWGNHQVTPAMNALSAATTPTVGHFGRPLPSLQQVEFGSVTMGWLDLAAPALLGLLVVRHARAAVATGLAAGAWGLLLMLTSPIAATAPVLAGLVAGGHSGGRGGMAAKARMKLAISGSTGKERSPFSPGRLAAMLAFVPVAAVGWVSVILLGLAVRLTLFRAHRTQGTTSILWGLGFALYLWAAAAALKLPEERAIPFALCAGAAIALFVYLRGAALENPPAGQPGAFQRRLVSRWLNRASAPSSPEEIQTAEQKRWLTWFGLPALIAAILVAITFGTGQAWILGPAIAAIIVDIGVLIWLTLSTDTNR